MEGARRIRFSSSSPKQQQQRQQRRTHKGKAEQGALVMCQMAQK